ncbi:MAG: AI-2E family transporter, partial [Methylococcaceae bacterium]
MNDFLNKTSVRSLIQLTLLAGLLSLSFMVMREFLLTLTWAFIIAYVMWPPYRLLKRRLNDKATLSASIMTAIIAAAILL